MPAVEVMECIKSYINYSRDSYSKNNFSYPETYGKYALAW